MFTTLPTAREAYPEGAIPDWAKHHTHDTVTLGWEDRLKTRARRRSDTGFEFATTLIRGAVLREGDCFVFDAPPRVVRVAELAEAVFVIRPASAREWALYAYHIGNSHQPLMLIEDGMVCADVRGMEQVLLYHGIPFTRERRAFTPVGQVADHQHQVAR